jgi:hypothetical protein
MVLVAGCSPRIIPFDTSNFTNKSFYQEMPVIMDKELRIDSVLIYQTKFEEKPYEGYYVIDYSEVNTENDKNILHYKPFKGYYQKLFLLKLVTHPMDSITIYFSLKYNAFDQCIGFGPSYIGRMDENKKQVFFNGELYTKNKKNNFNLKKSGLPLALYMTADEMISEKYINVEKMIVEKSFEIGDNVVIDIRQLFQDPEALKFHFLDREPIK